MSPKRGFTLIELLIVIAIIGVLSVVIIAAMSSARMKARDSKKISEFRQIEKAMQLYFDKYNTMPVYTNANCCNGDHIEKFRRMSQDLMNEGFLPSMPQGTYYYYYYGGTIGGLIVTTLEGIDATTVPPYNSCRPFSTGNWCDSTVASKYYCLCVH